MKRITIIGPGHPAGNPRLVRGADALAAAGYRVRVVGVRSYPRFLQADEALLAGRPWTYEAVDCLSGRRGRGLFKFARARRRAFRAVSPWLPFRYVDQRAYGYVIPELARLARAEPADLIIAHQQVTLPAAARAAKALGCRYGFDAEDLLADCPDEPADLVRRIERRYLPGCAFVTTMSEAAAERLAETNTLSAPPLVLHNTPAAAERGTVVPPNERPLKAVPSIYWFGQSLGPHACAEQVIRVLPKLARPVRLVLRGHPLTDYVQRIRELARSLDVDHLVEVAGVAPPADMVRLAAEHDILLGSQPGEDLFHQLAIGNKVFTGMAAGLALALTDTRAHRRLIQDIPGAGFLFAANDPGGLVDHLDRYTADPAALRAAQQQSWDYAATRYHWQAESQRLVDTVGREIGTP